ncbi:uncharacterized protein B0J16DRAFT_187778 [Fusarium flagelliforme]|uniref:uncharacterized protein n=1 Tax=Fusarium flagelliforme TaxID=2675880 RepID=UPI001E8DB3CF|nr:uncharacterized protein B0J16DRAFT_187778 [Fusarium flagelliforme]KAH7175191.1 hypothetical protein B0J16DRAFT_187778 [Fusarium flagelliforme]
MSTGMRGSPEQIGNASISPPASDSHQRLKETASCSLFLVQTVLLNLNHPPHRPLLFHLRSYPNDKGLGPNSHAMGAAAEKSVATDSGLNACLVNSAASKSLAPMRNPVVIASREKKRSKSLNCSIS